MGTNIPLVALAVHPPDPLQNAQGSMALRALGQQTQQQAALAPGQLQQQQQQLKLGQQAINQGQYAEQDREAGMKAMQQWSGKDQNELPDLIKNNGGSLDAVLNARKGVIASQQAVLNLNNAQLANAQTKNNYLLGKLQSATDKSIPDDQLAQSVTGATQQAIKDGYLDPQHAQEVQQLVQQFPDPADLRSHLAIYEKGLMSQTEQFDQEDKLRKADTEQQKADAADWKDFPTLGVAFNTRTGEVKNPTGKAMSPQQRALAGNLFYGAAGGDQQAKNALQLETDQKIQVARAGVAGAPSALRGVAPHLIPAATAAFDKAGQDYATAYQSAQNMTDFLQEARSGNKEAIKIVPLQGALEITTAQGVHRINRTEVDQYAGAGNLYDKLAGAVGGVFTGKNIPDNVLNDMDALQQTVSRNAKNLHADKVATINQSYGSTFQPMDFSQNNQSASGHVIAIGGKNYRYNGSGDTADLKNYTAVTR